jgi:hypothetical protein
MNSHPIFRKFIADVSACHSAVLLLLLYAAAIKASLFFCFHYIINSQTNIEYPYNLAVKATDKSQSQSHME